ncbi:glycolipid transfer [Cystoisospora suis]|uniref:Glycolipid transfer n=1 Tax=Cystoisospora suis TaxID=483139 RepID=A0A2C6L2I2_9APIC|nr:glycolipid transfer [Cystoisospora suis]
MADPRSADQLDPTKGEGLYCAVTTGFAKARAPDGRILCVPLAEAAKTIIPVYDTVFGGGMVSNLLKKDLDNSSTKVIQASARDQASIPDSGPITVDMMIACEVKQSGVNALRKDSECGVKNLLWMKRALDFVVGFLENVIFKMKGQSAKECATDVYKRVLKPYHGFMVSNVVTLAFGLCPTREELCKKLGFDDEAVVEDRVKKISEVCRPMLDEISDLLERSGCNFPDKV